MNASEIKRLALAITQVSEFRLNIALYDDLSVRDSVIESVTKRVRPQVRVKTLDVRDCPRNATIVDWLRSFVASASRTRAQVAIMVTNLEAAVDYAPELPNDGAENVRLLESANLQRELLPATVQAPVVFWMTELLERAFVKYAPDFWHWRSHVFDFRTRRPNGTAARDLAYTTPNAAPWHPADRLRQLEEQLAGYRRAGARLDEARVLNAMGLARLDEGDARLARRDFEAALSAARKLKEQRLEENALGNLAVAVGQLGNAEEAIKLTKRALRLDRKIGDRRGEGQDLGNLGNLYYDAGDLKKSADCHERALVIDREIGDLRGECEDLGNLANVYSAAGDSSRALELYRRCLEIARELRNPQLEALALGGIARIYGITGDAQKALDLHERELALLRQLGNRRNEALTLMSSALQFHALDNRAEALRRAKVALQLLEAINDPRASDVRKIIRHWKNGRRRRSRPQRTRKAK